MDDPSEADLSRMNNGSLDVQAELESISRFKELGMDTEGMEDLLFTDIEEYKKKKMELIHREIHGYGPTDDTQISTEPSLMKNLENEPEPPDGEILLEEDEEGDIDNELLIYTAPFENEKNREIENIDSLDLTDHPDENVEDGIIEESDILNDVISSPVPEKEKKIISGHSRFWGDNRILMGIISISIIVLIIGAYTAYDLIDINSNQNNDISPFIEVSDINPHAGDVIHLLAFPDKDRMAYKWEIQPTGYTIVHGGLDEKSISILFRKTGTYQITFRIGSGTDQKSTFLDLDVVARNITLEREYFGDKANYKVEGHLRLDRIYNAIDSSDIRDYSVLDIDFWTPDNKPMSTAIKEITVKQPDGLGKSFERLERGTEQTLKISGYLESDLGRRSTITGETVLDQNSYTDIYTKQPVSLVSDITYDLSFQTSIGTKNHFSNEKVWTYPSLSNIFTDLRVEDISPERHITIEDSGKTAWGSYRLDWTAIEYDRIMDIPSLRLDLSLDTSSMNRLSLSELDLSIWIGDGVPQIMKMVLNISSMRNVRTPYILDYLQVIEDHTKGEEPIIFRDFHFEHEIFDSIDDIYDDLLDEFHDDWDIVPGAGDMFSSLPSDFTAEDAITSINSNPNYRTFEKTLSDPYAIYTNFSIKLSKDQWRFSIADKGKDRAWNQTVLRETSPPGLASRVDPVRIGKEDIGPILTYSGAEIALKRIIGSTNPQGTLMVFGVNSVEDNRKIDTQRFFIGTMADMDYPALGLVNPTLSERIDYGLFVISTDGSIEIVLDMTSGQISYVRIVN